MIDSHEPNPARYTCYRARGPIRVDGRLDEPDWRNAPKSTRFVDIVTGDPAWFDTRVALLWDDQALYFGFWAEEPNVQATLTERDSKIWFDNDLEFFIAARDAYYEFEINALNTIYEVFWIWKDVLKPGGPYAAAEWNPARRRVMTLAGVGGHVHPRGERWGFLDWDFPGLEHAVHVDGTINDPSDTDRGWTVEIALPWEGFRHLADGRPLPPNNGDVWRIDCSRFQSVDRGGKPFPPGAGAGWTWNRHGHYDSHIPGVFPYVTFSMQLATR
jgi:hypothetical protein